jgi:hypothetical protein
MDVGDNVDHEPRRLRLAHPAGATALAPVAVRLFLTDRNDDRVPQEEPPPTRRPAGRRVTTPRENGHVPLVDITYDQSVGEEALRRLVQVLPDIVAEAVACPEEPWVGSPEPGDIEIRLRERSPHDLGELNVVIEVRTKLVASRVEDKQRRADFLLDRLSALGIERLGVWLILEEGAWSQR